MKNNKSLIGAAAIGIAAIMWGFDGVVLTPRLFNLNVSFGRNIILRCYEK